MTPHRAYVALRGAALLVSFVVMAWVPVLFAAMDTMPHIGSALLRNSLMVLVALRADPGWRTALLLVALYMLAPVLIALLLIDSAPVLWANIRLQFRIWWRSHLLQIRGG